MLSDMLIDEGSETFAGFGERLHGLDLLLAGDGIGVAVAVPVLKLDVDVMVSEGEGDDAGGSAEVAVGLHVGWMRSGWEEDGIGLRWWQLKVMKWSSPSCWYRFRPSGMG